MINNPSFSGENSYFSCLKIKYPPVHIMDEFEDFCMQWSECRSKWDEIKVINHKQWKDTRVLAVLASLRHIQPLKPNTTDIYNMLVAENNHPEWIIPMVEGDPDKPLELENTVFKLARSHSFSRMTRLTCEALAHMFTSSEFDVSGGSDCIDPGTALLLEDHPLTEPWKTINLPL